MEEITLYLDLRCSACRFMIYLKAPNAAGMPMPAKEEKRDASARSLISVSSDNVLKRCFLNSKIISKGLVILLHIILLQKGMKRHAT